MQKFALAQARWFALRFLLDERCFSHSGHQVTEETLLKHVSRDFNNDKKLVSKALSQLMSQGLILGKKKHYGVHLCLNASRLEEIRLILTEKP